jgi:streptogramin lyase
MLAFACLLLWVPRALAAPTSITEYPIEVGHGTNIDHLSVGADGTVWFADGYWPEGSFHALIGRLDPADGKVQEFDEGLGSFSVIRDFVAGPDGNMWFADSGSAGTDAAIGKVTPAGQIAEYASPVGGKPWWIIVGPDESLWFTATRAVGRVTTAGALGAYELPGVLGELATGPDGNVWFTYGSGANAAIGRVERHSDGSATITLFQTGLGPHSVPERIVAAGGYLWFTDLSEAEPAIGRVSADGQITEFRTGLAPNSYVVDLEPGPEGNVWFTDYGDGAVGRIDPTGQISEFTAEHEHMGPDPWLRHEPGRWLQHLVAGPDGNMWFNLSGGYSGIGKVSQSGHITTFLDGQAGLGGDSNPKELAAGPNGELWFVSNTGVYTQSIGRIVPGDDSPPQESSQTTPAPTPTLPTGRASLASNVAPINRHGWTHLKFTCDTTVTCSGRLTLIVRWHPFRHGRRQHRAMRVVGRAHLSIAAGDTTLVRIKLSRAVWRLLARRRRIAAALTVFETSTFPPSTRQRKIRLVRPLVKSHRHATHHGRG